ncbi:hypothetical protein HDU97_000598 [Phlyctochytrium planicorne]|nr:hypothetical protein HDU97_000598 [Phlyctochytrium planicorne]
MTNPTTTAHTVATAPTPTPTPTHSRTKRSSAKNTGRRLGATVLLASAITTPLVFNDATHSLSLTPAMGVMANPLPNPIAATEPVMVQAKQVKRGEEEENLLVRRQDATNTTSTPTTTTATSTATSTSILGIPKLCAIM